MGANADDTVATASDDRMKVFILELDDICLDSFECCLVEWRIK